MARFKEPVSLDFTLTDTDGHLVRLADYRGDRQVVLVFNRGLQ